MTEAAAKAPRRIFLLSELAGSFLIDDISKGISAFRAAMATHQRHDVLPYADECLYRTLPVFHLDPTQFGFSVDGVRFFVFRARSSLRLQKTHLSFDADNSAAGPDSRKIGEKPRGAHWGQSGQRVRGKKRRHCRSHPKQQSPPGPRSLTPF
jgi:hypothetical protein